MGSLGRIIGKGIGKLRGSKNPSLTGKNYVEDSQSIQGSQALLTADDIVFSDKFKLSKYKNQPAKIGWTNQKIADVINNPMKTTSSINKATGHKVTNYYINDIHYVAVDDITGKVIQIADLNDFEWVN